MLKNIMTLFQDLKSIFLLRLWPVLEHLFASMLVVCWLMLMILLPSIFSSDMAIGSYVAQRAGIGINAGRIQRHQFARIRGGEVQHTGVIPFLKKFEATVKCCTQNGVRGGSSATVHFPIWHKEIEDIIVLKNNKGTEDNRVRKLDYSIQIIKLFYERFINDEDITLFSPHEVPELVRGLGVREFDELYTRKQKEKPVFLKRK
jgi:ribonucleoside-diphosphate reductase alpha chain